MSHVNWSEFFNLLPFTVAGLVIHCSRQIIRAQKRNDYTWTRFIKLNGPGYLIAFFTSVLFLSALSSGLDAMSFRDAITSAIGIGITGGTLLRKVGASK